MRDGHAEFANFHFSVLLLWLSFNRGSLTRASQTVEYLKADNRSSEVGRKQPLDYAEPVLDHDREEAKKRRREFWILNLTGLGGLLLTLLLYWLLR